MPKVTVTIAPDGTTSIEVEGVKGKGCLELTRDIERALGKVTEDKKTSEYRERPRDNRLKARRG